MFRFLIFAFLPFLAFAECGVCQSAACGTPAVLAEFGMKASSGSGSDYDDTTCVAMSRSECEKISSVISNIIDDVQSKAEDIYSEAESMSSHVQGINQLFFTVYVEAVNSLNIAIDSIDTAIESIGGSSFTDVTNAVAAAKRLLKDKPGGNVYYFISTARTYIADAKERGMSTSASNLLTNVSTMLSSSLNLINTAYNSLSSIDITGTISEVVSVLTDLRGELSATLTPFENYEGDFTQRISSLNSSLQIVLDKSDSLRQSENYPLPELNCQPCKDVSGEGGDGGTNGVDCCSVVQGMAVDLDVIKGILQSILDSMSDLVSDMSRIRYAVEDINGKITGFYDAFDRFEPTRISRSDTNSVHQSENWFTRIDLFSQSAALNARFIADCLADSGYYFSSFLASSAYRAQPVGEDGDAYSVYQNLDSFWKRIEFLLFTISGIGPNEEDTEPEDDNEDSVNDFKDELSKFEEDLSETLQTTFRNSLNSLSVAFRNFASSLFRFEAPSSGGEDGVILSWYTEFDDGKVHSLRVNEENLPKLSNFLAFVRKAFLIFWHMLGAGLAISCFWAFMRFVYNVFIVFIKFYKDIV